MQNTDQVVDALKKQCICAFDQYIAQLQKGYQNTYDHILNMICLINDYYNLSNKEFITEYFLSQNYCSKKPVFIGCTSSDNNNSKYLIRNNFLSEYKTQLDKIKVKDNLGIKELMWNDVIS